MTNEAVKVELTNNTGFPRRFAVADGTDITKGSVLSFSDPRTAILSASVGLPIAGIASMAKEADDGATTISVWTDGVFEMVASGAITAGSSVYSSSDTNYPNTIHTTIGKTNPASGAEIIGYALADASDAETINVRVAL